jgi:hypothetical protein
LFFDGSDDFMLFPASPFSTIKTVVAVIDLPRTANSQRIWMIPISNDSNSTYLTDAIGTTANTFKHLPSLGESGTIRQEGFAPFTESGAYLYSAVTGAGTLTIDGFRNGTAMAKVLTAASTATSTATNGILGARGRGDGTTLSEYANLKISSLYFFNKALTPADLTRFQALVSQKWQVANLEYPANTNPDIFTCWIQNYNVTSGAWANINNINMEIIEDVS